MFNNINKIGFKGYVRYGLNPNEDYLKSKEKCAEAISNCPSFIQKDVADTLNDVTRSLKCIPTNDEFVVNAKCDKGALVLTAANFDDYAGTDSDGKPIYRRKCSVRLGHIKGAGLSNHGNYLNLLDNFKNSVNKKLIKKEGITPDDADSIMDYLV